MKTKFLVLWLAGIAATAAVLPYALTLQHDVIAQTGQPMAVIVLASILQTVILLAIAIFVGLKLAARLNLTTVTMFESDSNRPELTRMLKLALPLGVAVGLVIALGDKIFAKYIPQLTLAVNHMPVWKTLLAALYGGVAEEILMRLFLLSLLAWILGKIFRVSEPAKNSVVMWSAIIISSVLFGLGHLPVTAAITDITPIVVARAILLNGIGGLVFGWLYWKKGLEYGMVAHFTADIMLLVVLPAMFK